MKTRTPKKPSYLVTDEYGEQLNTKGIKKHKASTAVNVNYFMLFVLEGD